MDILPGHRQVMGKGEPAYTRAEDEVFGMCFSGHLRDVAIPFPIVCWMSLVF
jgi:hypothetical protein